MPGLYDKALKYDGIFYRHYSQSHGSSDLKKYFSDVPISQTGLCAASGLDWIKYYLTRGEEKSREDEKLYSNELMYKHRRDIITVQLALKVRDQALDSELLKCGMELQKGSSLGESVDAKTCEEMTLKIFAKSTAGTISYEDPTQGRHVAVFYVDKQGTLYFSDTHKGDVRIPSPGSQLWLNEYLEIFSKKCGELRVSRFEPKWNKAAEEKEMLALYRDSLKFGYAPKSKITSIFKNLTGQPDHTFHGAKRKRAVDDLNFENKPKSYDDIPKKINPKS